MLNDSPLGKVFIGFSTTCPKGYFHCIRLELFFWLQLVVLVPFHSRNSPSIEFRLACGFHFLYTILFRGYLILPNTQMQMIPIPLERLEIRCCCCCLPGHSPRGSGMTRFQVFFLFSFLFPLPLSVFSVFHAQLLITHQMIPIYYYFFVL